MVFSPASKKKKCEDLARILSKHKGQSCNVQLMFSGVFVNEESSQAKISVRVKHLKLAKNRLRVRRTVDSGISSNAEERGNTPKKAKRE